MITIKNTKSDKELVAHDYKDGKIVFNPGSQTGAKKSDYMFNDISVNIPGSNFQTTIKAQSEKEFDVSQNSIMGHIFNAISKEYGNENGGGDEPIDDFSVSFIVNPETGAITSDKTYAEISQHLNKKSIPATITAGENVVNANTVLSNPADNVWYNTEIYYGTDGSETPIESSDIIFYNIEPIPEFSIVHYMIGIKEDDTIALGIMGDIENINYWNFYYIYGENGEVKFTNVQTVENSNNRYFYIDNSVYGLVRNKGYTEKAFDADLGVGLSFASASLGEYVRTGITGRCGSSHYETDAGGELQLGIAFANNSDEPTGFESFAHIFGIDCSFNSDKEITEITTTLDSIPNTTSVNTSYDVLFDLSSNGTFTQVPEDIVPDNYSVAKLTIEYEMSEVTFYSPRSTAAITTDQDVTVNSISGGTETIPSGTVVYKFVWYQYTNNNYFDMFIWKDSGTWKLGAKISDDTPGE